MTLRKKLVISNLAMVLAPVVLVAVAVTACAALGAPGVSSISRQGAGDYLSRAQGILSTLEAGLSGVSWNVVHLAGDDGPEVILAPEGDAVGELESLGFHLQVSYARGLMFSNFDADDERALEAAGDGADGSLSWHGGRLVIQDTMTVDGMACRLAAVYDEDRADAGSASSMVPLYLVSLSTLALLVVLAALSVAVTAFLLTRWIARSVEEPLGELRAAAERVKAGDLDRRIAYPKQDEFGEVCDAFDGMRKRLKTAEDANARYGAERAELLRGVSHDLRSPLASIVGYASGIKDGIADTPEKRERYCDAILTRAADLERLTESLGVLVRAEGGGTLRPERLGVGSFVAGAVEAKRAWLESNSVEVDLADESDGACAMLDAAEMRRVLDNLFDNTVRHRELGESRVTIGVAAEGGFARIRYSDDGPGVAERHIGRIFESFYRADESRTRQGEGSGLGLSIVKRIAEAHGGWASAENDGGLAVTVALPVCGGDDDA